MTVMSGPSYAAWSGHGSKFGNLTLADTVPPEMSHLIDPHWYQFPPINPMWYPLVGFVIGVLGIISVIGNGMVVYIFCSTKSLRTPSNMFVINLAFSDFLMMFTMSPPVVGIILQPDNNISIKYIISQKKKEKNCRQICSSE